MSRAIVIVDVCLTPGGSGVGVGCPNFGRSVLCCIEADMFLARDASMKSKKREKEERTFEIENTRLRR